MGYLYAWAVRLKSATTAPILMPSILPNKYYIVALY